MECLPLTICTHDTFVAILEWAQLGHKAQCMLRYWIWQQYATSIQFSHGWVLPHYCPSIHSTAYTMSLTMAQNPQGNTLGISLFSLGLGDLRIFNSLPTHTLLKMKSCVYSFRGVPTCGQIKLLGELFFYSSMES